MSKNMFFGLILIAAMPLSEPVLAAGALDKNIEMTFACFEQCKRVEPKTVNGSTALVMNPVNTFTLSISKKDNRFELVASGGSANPSSSLWMTILHQYEVSADGKLKNRGNEVGIFDGAGNVEFLGGNGTDCYLKNVPSRGARIFEGSCGQDFSGLLELTQVRRSPFI